MSAHNVINRHRAECYNTQLFARMVDNPDRIYDTTRKYYFWDDQDQASLAGRALQQLSWTAIVRAAKVLNTEMWAVLLTSKMFPFLSEHVLLEKGAQPTVARRFTIVEGSLLLARTDDDPVGWAPPGSEIASLRDLKSIQNRLDVCLYLSLPSTSAFDNRFQDPRYKEAVWGDSENREYWRSRAYFWKVASPQHDRYHKYIDEELESFRSKEKTELKLLNSDKTFKGIHVRPVGLETLEHTLMWASEIVGAELGKRLLLDYSIEAGGHI
ncbi:hypothetical protein F4815DRAFT_474932 [Daldinia loculata]|nr:hypothetical protein F4815DRAFT_474932 [Daldinia loculata]